MGRFPARIFLSLVFLGIIFFRQSRTANASTLLLSPATGNQTLNTNFNVDVKFDAGADVIKTVKAFLTFPATLLSVDDILTTGSTIVNWNERLYSNTNGTINLNGDTLQSGLGGAGNLIATIKFKTKASGTAEVKFTASSQLLKVSGGADTLALSSSGSGRYLLGASLSQTPSASPSGTPLPKTGITTPTTIVLLLSFFLVTLGILMGRHTSRDP